MPRTVIPIVAPVFKVADTEAGLTAGDAYECQLTTAEIIGTPNMNDIPATGCAPATQSPGLSSWGLHLVWLQDWTAPGGGLSGFSFDNETQEVWFSLAIDNVNNPTVVATGHGYVTAGNYGGAIGGAVSTADTTWPLLEKPDIVTPAALPLAAEPEAEPEAAAEPEAVAEPVAA